MIGLLFFLFIGLWIVIAVTLGIKLHKSLGITRHPKVLGVLLTMLVLVAPVADEIIAYPQLTALCKSVESVEYDPLTVTGQTVSKYPPIISREIKTLFPNIQVLLQVGAYVTPNTEIPVVKWAWIEPHAGFLSFPAGSSGGSMPILLADCGFTPRSGDLRNIVDSLNLEKVDYQPTKYN